MHQLQTPPVMYVGKREFTFVTIKRLKNKERRAVYKSTDGTTAYFSPQPVTQHQPKVNLLPIFSLFIILFNQ